MQGMEKQKQENNKEKMETDSENSEQYQQVLTILQRLETALAALRQRVEPVNPELFKAMAQTYTDEIIEIRNELKETIKRNSVRRT